MFSESKYFVKRLEEPQHFKVYMRDPQILMIYKATKRVTKVQLIKDILNYKETFHITIRLK